MIRAITDIRVKTYSPPVLEYVLRASSGKLIMARRSSVVAIDRCRIYILPVPYGSKSEM